VCWSLILLGKQFNCNNGKKLYLHHPVVPVPVAMTDNSDTLKELFLKSKKEDINFTKEVCLFFIIRKLNNF